MKRLGRFRFVVYLFIALLLLLGGAKFLLSSSFAAERVAAKLSSTLGTPVRVGSVDIGFHGGSSIKGVEILEAGNDGDQKAWLTVGEVDADISAASLIAGDANSRELTFTGATVELRFDADGNLLTRLPKPSSGSAQPLPLLHVEIGKVTISQEGHKQPLVVENVTAQADSAGRILTITGAAHDSYWGDWSVEGTLDLEKSSATFRLRTDRADVTQEKLTRLPFVPPGVWEEVRIDAGVTPVDFTLTVQSEPPTSRYRVVLEPRDTHFHVPSIDLDAEQAHGKVVIADKVVEMREVSGRTADGTFFTEAALDFREQTSRLRFQTIRLDDVELQQLPESWKLKDYQISGKLSGKATIEVDVKPDGTGISTRGTGQGVIAQGHFRNLPIAEPIKLNLHSEGSRFRLRPEKPPVGLLPLPLDDRAATDTVALLLVALVAPPEPAQKPSSKHVADLLGDSAAAAAHGAGSVPQQTIGALSSAAAGLGRLLNQSGPAQGAAPSYLDVDLSLKDVDLRQTVEQLGLDLPFQVSGRLTIRLKLGVPIDTPKDFATYRLAGTADLPTFSIAGLDMTNVHSEVRLDKGVLKLEQLKAEVAGASLQGRAEIHVSGDYPFTAKVDLNGFKLDTLQRLSPSVRLPLNTLQGSLTASADVSGELRTQKFNATGTAKADDLNVQGVRVEALAFKFDATGDRVRLSDFRTKLYEGEVTGEAVLPLRDTVAGSVDLRVRDLDALALTKALPTIPVRLEGRVSGSVAATLPATTPDKPREASAKVELAAPKLRVQNIPTQRLHANINYRGGRASYLLEGESLGGTFKLEGSIPPAKEDNQKRGRLEGDPNAQLVSLPPALPPEEPDGRLTVENVRLSRIGEALGIPEALRPLGGRLSATLSYRHVGPGNTPVGNGRLRINDVRWGGRAIAQDVNAELLLTQGELRVREINALVGEGVLRASVAINLRERDRSHFTIHLDRADAALVLAPFPSLADLFQGTAEVNLRGTLGREWHASGSMGLTRGSFLGLGITEWRMPVSFSFVPEAGRGQFDIRDSVADVAHGRANGGVSVSWGTGTRIEGSFRFVNADFEGLARRSGSLRGIAVGKVTGRFDFGSNDFRTADDLNGVLDARLTQSQALELPVLHELVPFIAPGQSATTFQSGDVRARLSRGTFRIQRLSLMSPAVQLVVEGNVGLNGRLDLNATAQTGDLGLNAPGLRLLARGVPAIGPVPVTLIAQASALLANRVIHLRITGTTQSPVVRIDPIALLTEEAIRVFLTRYVVPLPGSSTLP